MPLTAQQKDCYEKFFKASDTDNNGYLTVHELRNILNNKLKLKCSNEEITEMFTSVDKNSDGKITLDEYMTEMAKINPKDLQKADIERAFAMIDTDNSRTLDCGEIKKLFTTCGHKVTDDQVKEIVKKLDKDGDGKINIDEFLKLF